MKKFKSELFLALILIVTATSAFAVDGQIPIVGVSGSGTKQTTAPRNTAIESENEISSEMSDYLWTFANIIRQFRF